MDHSLHNEAVTRIESDTNTLLLAILWGTPSPSVWFNLRSSRTIMKFILLAAKHRVPFFLSFRLLCAAVFIRKVTVIKGNKNPITTHQWQRRSDAHTPDLSVLCFFSCYITMTLIWTHILCAFDKLLRFFFERLIVISKCCRDNFMTNGIVALIFFYILSNGFLNSTSTRNSRTITHLAAGTKKRLLSQ